MGLFTGIDDPLHAPLPARFAAIAGDLYELQETLGIESYGDLGQSGVRERVADLDQRLRAALAHRAFSLWTRVTS